MFHRTRLCLQQGFSNEKNYSRLHHNTRLQVVTKFFPYGSFPASFFSFFFLQNADNLIVSAAMKERSYACKHFCPLNVLTIRLRNTHLRENNSVKARKQPAVEKPGIIQLYIPILDYTIPYCALKFRHKMRNYFFFPSFT